MKNRDHILPAQEKNLSIPMHKRVNCVSTWGQAGMLASILLHRKQWERPTWISKGTDASYPGIVYSSFMPLMVGFSANERGPGARAPAVPLLAHTPFIWGKQFCFVLFFNL